MQDMAVWHLIKSHPVHGCVGCFLSTTGSEFTSKIRHRSRGRGAGGGGGEKSRGNSQPKGWNVLAAPVHGRPALQYTSRSSRSELLAGPVVADCVSVWKIHVFFHSPTSLWVLQLLITHRVHPRADMLTCKEAVCVFMMRKKRCHTLPEAPAAP